MTVNQMADLNGGSHKSLTMTTGSELKLNFHNVNYQSKAHHNKSKKILNDCCGEFRSGRLTAILGPSGAGKTSMLNVLSAFKATGVTGHFSLNNETRDLLSFRKMASYIPQDFAMLDLLTVDETLKVSTELKLNENVDAIAKNQIITDILKILNMEKCRHTLVGHLSGGERKRLSIGVELVTNPPIMLFDEPTSGLDSVASYQLISYLRTLALDGRIIVCVVHQPSSRLIKLFDDVVVLSQGEILYCGDQREMLPQFERVGYNCPQYYNPADFVLEVASEERSAQITALVNYNKGKYEKIKDDLSTFQMSTINEKTKMLMPKMATEMNDTDPTIKVDSCSKCMLVRPKTQVSKLKQFYVLTRRSLISMSRNLIAVQLRIVMHIVVGTLLGLVFWDIGNDGAKVLTNASCQFFLVLFVFFGNAMPSILLCPQETAVFLREYLNGWYSITAYYAAKIIADLPMQFICPTIFISIVYVMTGQIHDVDRFFMCWGICLLTSVVGHFVGLVFGSTFDMQMAIFLVPGTQIPFMIFSGFFIRLHEVASYLRPLCDFSFFRYTLEGLMQAIYDYDRPDLACDIDFCYYKSPSKFLKDMGMLGQRYSCDIIVLLIWIVAFMILFFLSLVWRIKRAI